MRLLGKGAVKAEAIAPNKYLKRGCVKNEECVIALCPAALGQWAALAAPTPTATAVGFWERGAVRELVN